MYLCVKLTTVSVYHWLHLKSYNLNFFLEPIPPPATQLLCAARPYYILCAIDEIVFNLKYTIC